MIPSIGLLHVPSISVTTPLPFSTTRRRSSRSCSSFSVSCSQSVSSNIGGKEDSFTSYKNSRANQSSRAVFPGGYRRLEIRVPSLLLNLEPEDIVPGGESLDLIDKAISGAVSIVVLRNGVTSGKKLYEAACLIKSVVRERAYFLIGERVDIASAVNANGVVIDQGLPTLVARSMMIDAKPELVYLPLVAREVNTLEAAVMASNNEGADFLIYSPSNDQRDSRIQDTVKIPIFIANPILDGESYPLMEEAANVSVSRGCGVAISLDDLRLYGCETFGRLFESVKKRENGSQRESGAKDVANEEQDGAAAGFVKIKDKERELVEKEKSLLLEAIDVIQKAAPQMKEISLLVDSVAQIEDPFLLAIVGEFNSGKSTFINALLGERYLRDGVVPTTNEITLLRYSNTRDGQHELCERHPDGQYINYLPAPILKDINIVDTPGTNVILQRQQRLTEEFVPRADLLMFVISADRPLTESEVSFLRYTQQWKKKVVFVLNKSDMYRNATELEEAITFIKDNAKKILSTGDVMLYPVSSRLALKAKLSNVSDGRSIADRLSSDQFNMENNGFDELETYLYSFLDGSTNNGMERMKLKLETPIRIAERLLTACKAAVKLETSQAKEDLTSIVETMDSVKDYAKRMDRESIVWRRKTLSLIDSTKSDVVDILQSTLQLSNLNLVASYVFRGGSTSVPASMKVQNDVFGPVLTDAQKLLGEYVRWLQSNNVNAVKMFANSFERSGVPSSGQNSQLSIEVYESLKNQDSMSFNVLESFSTSTTTLFDNEIREVFLGTFGGLGAAGLSASILTSILPTTLEDLLALALCSAGGYISILAFPGRRKAVIDKVMSVADETAQQLESSMLKDLDESNGKMAELVRTIGKPYLEAAQERLDKLLAVQDELSLIENRISSLQIQIQNLHVAA